MSTDHVTATVEYITAGRVDPFNDHRDWEHHAWKVVLRYQGRQLTTPFYTGVALGEPTARDVLEALLSDAATIENAQDFEDWAANLGFDSDSRCAEKTYQAADEQTTKLKRFLGDAYQGAIWDSEEGARLAEATEEAGV
jgi:hypothetical protein